MHPLARIGGRWGLAVVILFGPAQALGAEPCAPDDGLGPEGHRDRGVALYTEAQAEDDPERYRMAARCFELAQPPEPSGPVAFNAATAWAAAGDEPRAADTYARALAIGGLAPDFAARARSELASLRERLTVVDVVAPVGRRLSVAHVDAAIPVSFHLGAGAYQIALACPAGVEPIPLSARTGDKERLALQCPAPAAEPLPPPPSGPSGLAIAGWTLVGVGALCGGVAAGLGAATLAARDDFEASGNRDASAKDRGETLRLATNVVAFSGLALALAGGTMLVIDLVEDDDEGGVALTIRPTGASLQARW